MILVAGLTPAWQQIVLLDRLRIGEVNRAREVHWCASGKLLNVGLALTQLGANVRALSLVGSGAAGVATRQDMTEQGVDVRWIESIARQRVCTTLLDRESGQTTEIVENSAPASESELIAFEAALAEEADTSNAEFLVLSGSLPMGTPKDYFATLLGRVRTPAILDIRGEELLAALPHQPLVVKPNREELGLSVRRELLSDDDIWTAMSALNARGAEWVVITNGPREVFASRGAERFRFQPPRVNVINPIGCGDCFTAGLAWSLQRGEEMVDAIRSGIAAAASNATQLLPARLAIQDVTSLIGQVVTESTA